ncbi:NAD-dependent epimerase/dehydratase family protein [Halocynthiibacter namhaensis]|uniref:NAD-dependent epimerase/dehydratase family protein n=1 Tax=Halocynthiibacter namhaensis TaxID=1290553 RepID=UPI0005795D35|nr:NAD(P)-dependent oxidoreductase [Halocynthiibacter namhaensis]
MRVLVTGATGFLGGAVSAHLAATGYDVLAIGRNELRLDALRKQGINCAEIDLASPTNASIDRIGRADAFIHCAALSAPWGRHSAFHRANILGTENALKIAETSGVQRFINISSPTIYFDFCDQENVTETHPLPKPVNAYAATKAEAERRVLAHQTVHPINLRPRGIYGANDTALLPRLLAAAKRGPLPSLHGGNAAIDLTHVSDVVSAIEAALVAGPEVEGHSFNISSGEQTLVRDIVELAAARADVSVTWRSVPLCPALAVARISDAVSKLHPNGSEPRITPYALGLFAYRQSLNIDKAKHQLDWSPRVPFSKGLELTFAGKTR